MSEQCGMPLPGGDTCACPVGASTTPVPALDANAEVRMDAAGRIAEWSEKHRCYRHRRQVTFMKNHSRRIKQLVRDGTTQEEAERIDKENHFKKTYSCAVCSPAEDESPESPAVATDRCHRSTARAPTGAQSPIRSCPSRSRSGSHRAAKAKTGGSAPGDVGEAIAHLNLGTGCALCDEDQPYETSCDGCKSKKYAEMTANAARSKVTAEQLNVAVERVRIESQAARMWQTTAEEREEALASERDASHKARTEWSEERRGLQERVEALQERVEALQEAAVAAAAEEAETDTTDPPSSPEDEVECYAKHVAKAQAQWCYMHKPLNKALLQIGVSGASLDSQSSFQSQTETDSQPMSPVGMPSPSQPPSPQTPAAPPYRPGLRDVAGPETADEDADREEVGWCLRSPLKLSPTASDNEVLEAWEPKVTTMKDKAHMVGPKHTPVDCSKGVRSKGVVIRQAAWAQGPWKGARGGTKPCRAWWQMANLLPNESSTYATGFRVDMPLKWKAWCAFRLNRKCPGCAYPIHRRNRRTTSGNPTGFEGDHWDGCSYHGWPSNFGWICIGCHGAKTQIETYFAGSEVGRHARPAKVLEPGAWIGMLSRSTFAAGESKMVVNVELMTERADAAKCVGEHSGASQESAIEAESDGSSTDSTEY